MSKPAIRYNELPEQARKDLDAIIDLCLDYDKLPAGMAREDAHRATVKYLERGELQLIQYRDGTFSLHLADEVFHHDNNKVSLKKWFER